MQSQTAYIYYHQVTKVVDLDSRSTSLWLLRGPRIAARCRRPSWLILCRHISTLYSVYVVSICHGLQAVDTRLCRWLPQMLVYHMRDVWIDFVQFVDKIILPNIRCRSSGSSIIKRMSSSIVCSAQRFPFAPVTITVRPSRFLVTTGGMAVRTWSRIISKKPYFMIRQEVSESKMVAVRGPKQEKHRFLICTDYRWWDLLLS